MQGEISYKDVITGKFTDMEYLTAKERNFIACRYLLNVNNLIQVVWTNSSLYEQTTRIRTKKYD